MHAFASLAFGSQHHKITRGQSGTSLLSSMVKKRVIVLGDVSLIGERC